ncbi:FCD domain-containing protein [Vibrio sp. TH_r3]|uniref:GntR family transcriptional regulator n=1 Tax=Vibrio sp. TH_r3 TaxID=3082084 RepID=UPI002955C4B6|nr:FCD domain-containing protein [Vibrio sp. TH_r3]MDV7105556.1 FCD domain-containing protein [Vibrio sp. TH_r3]
MAIISPFTYKTNSPLREALSRLAESQLLINSGQRGFRVPEMSSKQFEDITETRINLECMALKMAIEKGDMEWESRVVAAYHMLSQQEKTVHEDRDISQESRDKLDLVHDKFHQALLSGSESEWLLFFVKSLNAQFDRYRRYSVSFQFSRNTSVEYHLKLKNLVLERDIPAALKTLEEHIRHSAKAISVSD